MNKKTKFEIEKSSIWKVLEDTAPATFPPYSNLEDKQFPAISHQELFRLRKIKKDYLTELAESLRTKLGVNMLMEFDSYGSGYASYIALFLYRLEDIFEGENVSKETDGVLIYISNEVPAYIFGKHTLYGSNCLQFQSPSEELEEKLDSFWEAKTKEFKTLMDSLNFKHLTHNFLKQDPDFACNLFTDTPYDGVFSNSHKTKIFDLFFHWAS